MFLGCFRNNRCIDQSYLDNMLSDEILYFYGTMFIIPDIELRPDVVTSSTNVHSLFL
jgi:hypothetical protein